MYEYTDNLVKRLVMDYPDLRAKCIIRGPSYGFRVSDGHLVTREDMLIMLADVMQAAKRCLTRNERNVFRLILTVRSPHPAWTHMEWIQHELGIKRQTLDATVNRIAWKICDELNGQNFLDSCTAKQGVK